MEDGVLDGTRRPQQRRGLGRGLGAILPARDLPYLPPHTGPHQIGSNLAEPPADTAATVPAKLESAIDKLLEDARLEGTSLALVAFGLDRFRHVNAEFGHDVGDALLIQLAERTARSRRAGDVVARLRGDEFVVVCPRATSALERTVARLATEIERPLVVAGAEHRVRATFGVTVTEPGAPNCSPRSLLGEADVAMHRAKDDGARWARYEPAMRQPDVAERRQESPESAASPVVARRGPEPPRQPEERSATASVRYRPVVDAHSRLVAGARSSFAPSELPLARLAGDLRGWDGAAGLPPGFRVWLDVSASAATVAPTAGAEVLRHELAALAASLDQASGPDDVGRRIGVVLRGTAAADTADDPGLRPLLTGLVAYGVGVGVDVGALTPASLTRLGELPLEMLWVPAALLHDAPDRPGSTAVATAIAAIGRDLGIDVVVDGADTESVVAAMTELGFHLATGALFGGPLSAERFAGLLWASVGAYQAARWNTASGDRGGRPEDDDGGSSGSASPTRTAPT